MTVGASFVKDINVVGDKMTRNGGKMTISKSCIFFNQTDFRMDRICVSTSHGKILTFTY
jgi:hypothetical protein